MALHNQSLSEQIRSAQIRAGEDVVTKNLQRMGLIYAPKIERDVFEGLDERLRKLKAQKHIKWQEVFACFFPDEKFEDIQMDDAIRADRLSCLCEFAAKELNC